MADFFNDIGQGSNVSNWRIPSDRAMACYLSRSRAIASQERAPVTR